MGTRRRLTPEYRRDVASLVLDTGSTNRICGDGGFAPLEALPRRVAGVSRLSWCNSPCLVAPSTWGELDRASLMVHFPRLLAVSSESRSRPGSPALSGPLGVRRNFGDGGFAPLEALPRRVAPLMLQFPPFGGGKVVVRGGVVAVRGGVAPKVQTTSAKNADNGVSWAKWSAFWAKLSRTWCVVRTRTRYCVR